MSEHAADRQAWRRTLAAATLAPASYTLLALISDSIDDGGINPLVVASMIALAVAGTIAMAAAGAVGGVARGAIATAVVWILVTIAVYIAFDPACGLEMSATPQRLAVIDPAPLVCGTGTPSRWNNADFPLVAGILATLVAAVAGLIAAIAHQLRERLSNRRLQRQAQGPKETG